ncbi:ATP-binding cassette, subfamily B [Anaerosporobacter mobilis DSM 15930]|jgi:ATP-binding cassette subfamily B protein|uniref:ATP-binding cassette, subfamily B n=1 Tax=Anaerosporobacter mobilis DSM 15930 TaxID=1120996 RepID=A0A1M7K768_9FIRM|nr:ABC transporter ATP-binding protein [Anaerosporobacter mobilis]SHM61031.1 ATP-binding cassette, subfamily B [Anaerosporobacter mobilis DSM 15930]
MENNNSNTIEKKENQFAVLARILQYAKPYRNYLFFAFISAFISVVVSLFIPVLIGRAIDVIVGKGNVDFNRLISILIVIAVAIAISAVFQWIMTYCTNKITFLSVRDLRMAAFDKLIQVPLRYIDGTSHGNIMNTMINDIDQISDGLLQGFAQLFTGVITIVGTLVIMLFVNFKIALIVIIMTPLSMVVASFISKRTYNKFKEQSSIRGELGGYIEEVIGNQKVVTAFCYEDRAQEKFEEINQRLYDCGVMAQFYSSLTNPCTRFLNGLVYAVVAIIGALSVIGGAFSVGQLSSFLTYANQYTKPFNEISGVVAELQSAFASARRVFTLLDQEIEVDPEEQGGSTNKTTVGKVDLDKVSFSYNKEVSLIEDWSLAVKPGQRIAIVGPTGCGKTTVINLLMRFYDVDGGSIQVDNRDIKTMSREELRRNYGMVLQETWLFHGTVRENIAYGKENATMDEIIAAAKGAHAHSFIKRLPNGYDTVISEEGDNISQGQKQLLCIARIMLTKPPMLILDEATSNIDTRTEINIQKAFKKLMEGRTSFIIAHRLSTIKDADRILVMDKGRIIEQGSHEELLVRGGYYAKLYNSQFKQV